MQLQKQEHAPTLNTILMVETTLKKHEQSLITLAELKRQLPRQVNHNTLKTILAYLEESNKICTTIRGITWIHNTNPILKKAINKAIRV